MFGHPSQDRHKLQGMAKAAASPKTPAHLRPHIQKRLQEASMAVRNQTSGSTTGRIDNLRRAGRVPQKNILRSDSPADVAEQSPIDKASFETEGNLYAKLFPFVQYCPLYAKLFPFVQYCPQFIPPPKEIRDASQGPIN